jgi:hypothetical protein
MLANQGATVVMINDSELVVFWVMTLCILVWRYQHFEETCCINLQHRGEPIRLHVVITETINLNFADV